MDKIYHVRVSKASKDMTFTSSEIDTMSYGTFCNIFLIGLKVAINRGMLKVQVRKDNKEAARKAAHEIALKNKKALLDHPEAMAGNDLGTDGD